MASERGSRLRSEAGVRAFMAVLMVAAVGVATIGLPVAYGGPTATAEAADADVESYETISQAESELDPADHVYLREDGSAVLQYDDDDADVDQFDLGMDVSEGLVHMLVVDEYDQDDDFEEANFSAVLDQNGFTGDGSLVMQQPADVEDLSVDVTGEVTDETNEFDATATGTFQSSGTAAPGEISTDGHVTATADRLETSGTATVDYAMGMGADDEGTTLDVSLDDTTDGYAVDVTREETVYDWSADRWETRDQAEQTLQEEYGTLASNLGGTSDIQIDHYDFEERDRGQYRLELEFSVEYTGIDDGIERQLTDELANDPSSDLTRSDAETIAESVTDIGIETFEFTMTEQGAAMEAEWDIALTNYDEVTVALIDLAEASSMSEQFDQADFEDARAGIEAQQAADLTTELEWDVAVEGTSTGEMELDAEITSETDNWAAYIDELEARGVDTQNDVSFSLTAETDGEELTVNGQFDIEAEDLAGDAINAWAESIQNDPTTTTMSSDTEQFVTALSESELEVARVDADIGDGTVRVEGGAEFANMSAVTDTFSDSLAISGIASEHADETSSIYVYVDDVAGVDTETATKSDVEHLGVVDSETTVHAAGDWDEEFPEPDTAGMSDYLDVSSQSEEAAEEDEADDGDSIPGFGVGVSLTVIAGLLTTLVLRRQAQE